ncbi:response regulator [Bacillus sp. IITD106]|nr:response regulator [Bacillus sp. IITD106]
MIELYRLLIVDDEPIIVDGLTQLFSEQEMEFDIYPAYSVSEALERAIQTKIDIVIADMRMPNKNGLQLIDEIQSLWPQCRIIFLTGYDDFDYVYNAIKRNIDSYILKTEDDEVLLEAVRNSIKKLEEERSFQEEIELGRRRFEQMIPFVKREKLEELLKGEIISELTRQPIAWEQTLEIDLNAEWHIVAGVIDSSNTKDKMQMLYEVQELFVKKLHSHLAAEYLIYDHTFAVWFIQPKKIDGIFFKDAKPKWERIKEYIIGNIESVQENFDTFTDSKFSFVIGRKPVEKASVSKEFYEMCECLKVMSFLPQEMMIVDLSKGDPFFKDSFTNHKDWKKELPRLEGAISSGNLKEAMKIVDSLFEGIFSIGHPSTIEIGEFLCSISLLLWSFMRNKELHHYFVRENDVQFELLEDFPAIINSKERAIFFVKKICHYQTLLREESKNNTISLVNEFIKKNISGDLSLVTIAKSVYLNPSYLSRFYKEHTGMNLSDFINQVKIEQAKYYLSETDMFIQTIANKLGFNSPSYFTLFFRKHVNQSPQEYRERHLKW